MTNNEILNQLRNALSLHDKLIIEIFQHSGFNVTPSQLKALLKNEQAPGFVKCKDSMMVAFLDGFIIHKRGAIEKKTDTAQPSPKLSNNMVLKKMRIALKFHESDMLDVMQLAEIKLSKSELNALFRIEGHKKYNPCDDSFLSNFLKGLSIRFRKD